MQYFLILENEFLILENEFLILENIFNIRKQVLNSTLAPHRHAHAICGLWGGWGGWGDNNKSLADINELMNIPLGLH